MQQYLEMRHHGKLARIRMVSDGAYEYAKNTKVIPMLTTNLPSNQQYVLALVRESLGIPTEYPTSVDPYDIVKIILHNRILLTVAGQQCRKYRRQAFKVSSLLHASGYRQDNASGL